KTAQTPARPTLRGHVSKQLARVVAEDAAGIEVDGFARLLGHRDAGIRSVAGLQELAVDNRVVVRRGAPREPASSVRGARQACVPTRELAGADGAVARARLVRPQPRLELVERLDGD